MIGLKELFETFFGKTPVEKIARQNLSIKDGVISFAMAYLLAAFLFSLELLIARLAFGLLQGEELVGLAIGLGILVLAIIIAVPLFFLMHLAFFYVLGLLVFFTASFYRKDRGSLNDFNGAFITVAASVLLVSGLCLLIPIVGWIASVIACVYGVVLVYRFVREMFRVNDSQAAVITLIPINLVLALILMVVTAISFFLIGTRIW